MSYPACPKCRHAPLPEKQDFPAACPACGVILAKVGMVAPRRMPAANEPGRLAALLLAQPAKTTALEWRGRMLTLAGLILWTVAIWRDMDIAGGEPGSAFLHAVLLPFHEAGHFFLSWAGRFLYVLGGTLGQHAMAATLCLALLLKRRDGFGAAVFCWLLGFSVADMAVYMYDALEPKLTLLGGGTGAENDGHDWMNLFAMLGIGRRAQRIGLFFGAAGKAVMLLALLWAGCALRQQKTLAAGRADDGAQAS
ncbi:hypothetical protein SAMN06265795_101177 [Noviherbaspirillum humi]|uniref:Uncharacterized protein n=1 Tax=Noviherbaspirillum humi TaxID=1688639 RepID=A0A239C1U0_9BURK|nr:hypothetical protein [Noviherbaspirillum humi]SNS13343.1 hypothetical protein SAMN06265795_101177 [Noviherbaspirillum humi]